MRARRRRRPGRIQPGHQALCRRFLVASRAVDLPGQNKPDTSSPPVQGSRRAGQRNHIQWHIQARMQAFSRPGTVARTAAAPPPANWSRCRSDNGVVVQPLWLQEDLVPLPVGETDHLVLDRGTVAWPDDPRCGRHRRRAMQIGTNEVVSSGRGPGNGAGNLAVGDPLRHPGQWFGRIVARLSLHRRPIDSLPVQPRRRSGLQPRQRKAKAAQRVGQPDGRSLASSSPGPRGSGLADMDQPPGRCRW